MKLAVRKEEGSIPGGGFHYMLTPKRIESDNEAAAWEQMGHVIIEVSEDHGVRLMNQAGAAINHQVEVAVLTERALEDRK